MNVAGPEEERRKCSGSIEMTKKKMDINTKANGSDPTEGTQPEDLRLNTPKDTNSSTGGPLSFDI